MNRPPAPCASPPEFDITRALGWPVGLGDMDGLTDDVRVRLLVWVGVAVTDAVSDAVDVDVGV